MEQGAATRADGASAETAGSVALDVTAALDLEQHGAALHRGAALSILPALDAIAAGQPAQRAGIRLRDIPALSELLVAGPVHTVAAHYLGPDVRPVRAILFDKTAQANWSLGWHQDRTVAVVSRCNLPGFGPWTTKQGILHVAPPFAVIERMVTLRIHLDDVPIDNAPLLIAPGSHRLGRLPEETVERAVRRCGVFACVARRGDIWAYATPILHASGAARGDRRRRVLQIDYAADALPGGLEWLGV